MKSIAFLILSLNLTFTLYSQSERLIPIKLNPPAKHLEPIDSINMNPQVKEYEKELFPVLYDGFSEKPIARFTAFRSFSSEYAFSAERNSTGYYIISNTLSNDFWNVYITDKNTKKVKVSTAIIKINQPFYQLIVDLFKLVIEQTQERKIGLTVIDGKEYYLENVGITDAGVSYFATSDHKGNLMMAKDCNGDQSIQLDQLVAICDKIYSLSIYAHLFSETEIKEEIKRLISELKQ
jgi:hypothetical protein